MGTTPRELGRNNEAIEAAFEKHDKKALKAKQPDPPLLNPRDSPPSKGLFNMYGMKSPSKAPAVERTAAVETRRSPGLK